MVPVALLGLSETVPAHDYFGQIVGADGATAMRGHPPQLAVARFDEARLAIGYGGAAQAGACCALPRAVEERCIALMRKLGLAFGCIDLIVTPEGEDVFLEVNEMGQFLWVEHSEPRSELLRCFATLLLHRQLGPSSRLVGDEGLSYAGSPLLARGSEATPRTARAMPSILHRASSTSLDRRYQASPAALNTRWASFRCGMPIILPSRLA